MVTTNVQKDKNEKNLTSININSNVTIFTTYHLELDGENWPPVFKTSVTGVKKKENSSEQYLE